MSVDTPGGSPSQRQAACTPVAPGTACAQQNRCVITTVLAALLTIL